MAQAVLQPTHTVVPYLRVKGAAEAIEFYAKALANGAASTHFNVPDCHSVFQQAVAAGATAIMMRKG